MEEEIKIESVTTEYDIDKDIYDLLVEYIDPVEVKFYEVNKTITKSFVEDLLVVRMIVDRYLDIESELHVSVATYIVSNLLFLYRDELTAIGDDNLKYGLYNGVDDALSLIEALEESRFNLKNVIFNVRKGDYLIESNDKFDCLLLASKLNMKINKPKQLIIGGTEVLSLLFSNVIKCKSQLKEIKKRYSTIDLSKIDKEFIKLKTTFLKAHLRPLYDFLMKYGDCTKPAKAHRKIANILIAINFIEEDSITKSTDFRLLLERVSSYLK